VLACVIAQLRDDLLVKSDHALGDDLAHEVDEALGNAAGWGAPEA
jgi:hypothetical protein